MGYIIGQIDKIKCRVEFDLPVAEGEPALKGDFSVEFKIPSVETAKERLAAVQKFTGAFVAEQRRIAEDPTIVATLVPGQLDEQYIREDVINIVGIADKTRKQRDFSSALLKELLNDPVARKPLLTCWMQNIFQGGALKIKN